jgi:hypothetical protein
VNAQEFKTRAEALAGMSRKDSHEVHALVSHLIDDGMTKTDAIHAVAEEIDSSAQSVSAAYYRRQRERNGVTPHREDHVVTRAATSAKRMQAIYDLLEQAVEERAAELMNERIAKIREALG